jgi:hypothetical protein
MKEGLIYQAEDGTQFTNKALCLAYESEAAEVEEIIDKLHPLPATDKFSSGEGYLQHAPEVFVWVRAELLEIVKRHYNHIHDDCNQGFAGRVIDDSGIKYLKKAWWRIMCTDEQFREWGQPYFATNPGEVKAIRLN